MSTPIQQDVYARVVGTIAEALNVDEDEVTPEATLQGDLGAESLDFLDIVFRLEREFAMKIPRGELFPESIFQGDPDYVQGGQVTAKGLALMKEKMPFMDFKKFEQNPEVTAISDLFTVGAICRYVQSKLSSDSVPFPQTDLGPW